MTLHILHLPDSPEEFPLWLEQHFVGGSLGELVRELIVANRSAADDPGLQQILSHQQIADVIEQGLSVVSDPVIRLLIKHPRAMLELQEEVIVTGSAYWDAKFAAGPLAQRASDISKAVNRRIADSEEQPVTKAATPTPSSRRNIGVLVAGFASAVAILVAVLNGGGPSPSGRILGQPGLTANDTGSSAAYFKRLADAAATWVQHMPTNEQQLETLLADTINDCEVLIEADHDALSDAERVWFRKKCGIWKGKLETTLANLESGSSTFEEALGETKGTMDTLQRMLKEPDIA